MSRSGPLAASIALILSAALAACGRNGPPAPLAFPGAETKPQAAAPPALVPQEHRAHPSQITVSRGDTLYTIAQRYDVPLRSIIDANHLDPPFRVAAGTRLELPQERFHVVKQGDTLYGIARLYGVEVSALASLNRLNPPYALRSGETLYLPAAVEPPEKPSIQREATGAAPPAGATAPLRPRVGKGFDWPVQGKIIEGYGTGPNGTHNDGINIAARPGEPVRAADAGVVAYAGNELRGYGNLVLIKHPGGYMTAYAHNSQLLVKRGEAVRRGQEIAKAGSTGTVDAPQVHFEIRQGTRALDPTSLLPSIQASAR